MKSKILVLMMLAAFLSLFIFGGCNSGGGSGSNEVAYPIGQSPKLENVDPSANDSSVLVGSGITATFDQDMDPATVGNFVVYGSLTGKLSGVYSGGGSDTLRFDPDAGADFKIGEEIEVILTDLLTSTDGLSLESPVVYRFRAEARGGSGDFTEADTVAGQLNVSGLAAGDWDGDGDLDLAVANNGASQVSILENDGTGDFTEADTVAGQLNAIRLAAGDWDGDGDLDLAVANNGASQVSILENDGTGDFTEADTVAGQLNASGLAAGDWDGDGDLDLAVANNGANTVVVLVNQP
jgi:hypothetical protein